MELEPLFPLTIACREVAVSCGQRLVSAGYREAVETSFPIGVWGRVVPAQGGAGLLAVQVQRAAGGFLWLERTADGEEFDTWLALEADVEDALASLVVDWPIR